MNNNKHLFTVFTFYSCKARLRPQCSLLNSTKNIFTSMLRQTINTQSLEDKSQNAKNTWRSYVRQWQWRIPLGLGISLLAVLQWRYFRKRHEINKGPIEGLMVTFRNI